ncbi:agamous-like MADS-box protein AGL62 [Cornus florida]|uniref:agamous-like MADS-box protein AGL62 n=1 Tax=Cornus florida TaxID=4283 RepID=UPI00289C502C|nr:agamous-like MADS-box protein AGL62 [Cornus florida]
MEKQPKKKGMGRRKIEIRKIEKKSHLMTSFSKRRGGLFKKAAELSTLCGANVAVIVKCPAAEKIHAFGTPSVDAVFNRFLSQNPPEEKVLEECERNWWDVEIDELGLNELEDYKTALEVLRNNVVARADEMAMASASACSSNLMESDLFEDIPELDFTDFDFDFDFDFTSEFINEHQN